MLDPRRFLYVPLDIPPVEFDRGRLLSYFDEHKSLATQDFLKALDFPWNTVQIRPDWLKPEPDEIPGSGWDPLFRENFPQFVEQIEGFPFRRIDRIYILEQVKEVKAHQDVSREDDSDLGPSTFRCPLINDAPERTFYMMKGSRNDGTLDLREIYPRLPQGAQWFGMNNYQGMHGSHMPENHERKLMLCIWGRVIPEKWLKLLEASIEKYRTHCIEV